MLKIQPGLCCVSLQMASSIQMGLLPCCCFASPDLSKAKIPPPLSHPPPSSGDSAPPLLWLQLRGGREDAENRDYFGFSDLQKQLLAVWGRGGAGAGFEWVDVNVWKALGVGQDWRGLMGGKRAEKDSMGA